MEFLLGVVIGALALTGALMGRTLYVHGKLITELRAEIAAQKLARIVPPEGERVVPVPEPKRKRRGALATVTAIGSCARHVVKGNRFATVAAVATATATAVTIAALTVLGEHTSSSMTPPEAGPPRTSAPPAPGPEHEPTPERPPNSPPASREAQSPKSRPLGGEPTAEPARPREVAQTASPRADESAGRGEAAGAAPQPSGSPPPPRPAPAANAKHCVRATALPVPRPGIRVCLRSLPTAAR